MLGYHLAVESVRGQPFFPYLTMDLFSRKIVGWEVHENESDNYCGRLTTTILAGFRLGRPPFN